VLVPVALVALTVAGCAGIMNVVERWVPRLGTEIGLKRLTPAASGPARLSQPQLLGSE
jgi:hypothetical protein